MRIESGNVQMNSVRNYEAERSVKSTISFHINTENGYTDEKRDDMTFTDMLSPNPDMENSSSRLDAKLGNSFVPASDRVSSTSEKTSYETIRHQCILFLLKVLINRKGVRDHQFREMLEEMKKENMPENVQTLQPVNLSAISPVITETVQTYQYESETVSFQADGVVKTADGREINFRMDVMMSREFASYAEENYELPNCIDPLVISLDGNIPSLSDQKFMFDLDSDGTLDRISMLEAGSGYLVLDKNGDGKISDGSELFGTSSGDGFRDLAQYDFDGNGWIDEADPIFDKLMVWTKDENGNQELYSIKEAGVGAICLQKAATDFSLTSLKNNQLNGKIRSTGIFVYENGDVGTLQHLDVAT